jgi:hypothetical protein
MYCTMHLGSTGYVDMLLPRNRKSKKSPLCLSACPKPANFESSQMRSMFLKERKMTSVVHRRPVSLLASHSYLWYGRINPWLGSRSGVHFRPSAHVPRSESWADGLALRVRASTIRWSPRAINTHVEKQFVYSTICADLITFDVLSPARIDKRLICLFASKSKTAKYVCI